MAVRRMKIRMVDIRDVKRKLVREAAKGKCTPLEFIGIRFPEQAYGAIRTPEQLEQQLDLFLRLGEFKPEDDRGCQNNAYFHRGLLKNELSCTRCHNELQRKECKFKVMNFNRVRDLDYGKVICEKVLCEFYLDDAGLEKCRYNYQGNDTYAFLLSHTYLFNIYELCRRSRLTVVADGVEYLHLSEAEQKHVSFEDIKTGIFQTLLFDDVSIVGNSIFAKMYTIMLLE